MMMMMMHQSQHLVPKAERAGDGSLEKVSPFQENRVQLLELQEKRLF